MFEVDPEHVGAFLAVDHEVWTLGEADVMGLDTTMIVSAIAIAASCAFILPVATPPNAIVFSSGYIPQNTMMKVGLILNLIFSMIITSYMFWL